LNIQHEILVNEVNNLKVNLDKKKI